MRTAPQTGPTVDKIPKEEEYEVKIETSVPAEPKAPLAKEDYSSKQTFQSPTEPPETANDNERKSCTFSFHLLQLVVIALLLLGIGGVIGGLTANAWDKDDEDNVSTSTDEDNISKPADTIEETEPSSPTNDDPTSFSAASRFPPNGDWTSLHPPTCGDTLVFSGDGTILAMGTRGEIQVYQNQGESSDWIPLGNSIDIGSSYVDALVLSSKGDILAVGDYESGARAYSLVHHGVSASWEQLGKSFDHSHSLAISPDGGTIALCGEGSYVSVYDYIGSQWIIRDKWSERSTCNEDTSLALSEMGEFLVIGDENEGDNGKISLFKYEGNDGERLMENGIIYGKNRYGSFGSTVKVSTKNGLIVAVASRRYQGSYGLAQVFLYKEDKINNEKTSSLWQQLGQDLIGKIDGAQYGWTVDLSEDGLVLAIGSGEEPVANVFYLDGYEWKTPPGPKNLASVLDEYDEVNAISLSSDGTKVAFCSNNGHAKMFYYHNYL